MIGTETAGAAFYNERVLQSETREARAAWKLHLRQSCSGNYKFLRQKYQTALSTRILQSLMIARDGTGTAYADSRV